MFCSSCPSIWLVLTNKSLYLIRDYILIVGHLRTLLLIYFFSFLSYFLCIFYWFVIWTRNVIIQHICSKVYSIILNYFMCFLVRIQCHSYINTFYLWLFSLSWELSWTHMVIKREGIQSFFFTLMASYAAIFGYFLSFRICFSILMGFL